MTRFLLVALMCCGVIIGVEAQAPTSAQNPRRTALRDQLNQLLIAMLERSTEDCRRMLFFARQEVTEWGSSAIEPEHLLLGIIREGKGPAYELLFEKFALNVTSLRVEVESHIERKPSLPESVEVPFSSSAKEVLIATVKEADRLQQEEIRPEHLLLGILRVSDSIPASILAKHGVSLESARERLGLR